MNALTALIHTITTVPAANCCCPKLTRKPISYEDLYAFITSSYTKYTKKK